MLTFGDYIDNKADLWNMDKYPVSIQLNYKLFLNTLFVIYLL